MRNILFATGALGLIFLGSCKEKGPIINFGNNQKAVDTTYVAAVETASPKNVLVEEFTGATCTNCPAARTLLGQIESQNSGRVISMELHPKEHPLGKPVSGAAYDFRNQSVSDALNLYFGGGLGSIPIAGIDRLPVAGQTLIEKANWSSTITSRLAVSSPANMTINSSYDAATKNATVKVRIAYTSSVNVPQYLSVAVLEDSLIDKQEYVGYVDDAYVFMHVQRGYITPVSGIQFLSNMSTIEAGRVYERTFTYKVDDAWKPEHCKLVAILHHNTGTDKEVVTAVEGHME